MLAHLKMNRAENFGQRVNLAHQKPTLRIQNPSLTSNWWPSLGCGYQAKSLVQRGLVAKLVLLNVTSKGPPSFSPGVHYCNAPPIFCQLFHNTALVKMPGQGAPWTQSWSPLLSRRETFFRDGLVVQVFGIKVGQCHANPSRTIR